MTEIPNVPGLRHEPDGPLLSFREGWALTRKAAEGDTSPLITDVGIIVP